MQQKVVKERRIVSTFCIYIFNLFAVRDCLIENIESKQYGNVPEDTEKVGGILFICRKNFFLFFRLLFKLKILLYSSFMAWKNINKIYVWKNFYANMWYKYCTSMFYSTSLLLFLKQISIILFC